MSHYLMIAFPKSLFFPRQTTHSFNQNTLREQSWHFRQSMEGNHEQNTGTLELSSYMNYLNQRAI